MFGTSGSPSRSGCGSDTAATRRNSGAARARGWLAWSEPRFPRSPAGPDAGFSFPREWIRAETRNPATRRNLAAARARGSVLAFIDDDAQAETDWLEAGVQALETAELVGGPDVAPSEAPYLERISDLLLATRRIGSGIPAHERAAAGGPVPPPHDLAPR